MKPPVYKLDESSTIRWHGLFTERGDNHLKFTIDGDGKYAPLDVRWLSGSRGIMRAVDAQGNSIRLGTGDWLEENGWRLKLKTNFIPVKVVLNCPIEARTYAGMLDFKNVPVPKLSPIPGH